MELSSEPLAELLPFPFLPWNEPVPGPDDAPQPPWPFPPRLLAEAALGGALLAFVRTESVEDLEHDGAVDRLRDEALDGMRSFLQAEVSQAAENLTHLRRTTELLG